MLANLLTHLPRARDYVHARDWDSDLDPAFDLALDDARARARARDLARAFELDLELELAGDLALARDLASALDQAHALATSPDSFAGVFALINALDRNLDHARSFLGDSGEDVQLEGVLEFVRWYLRVNLLVIAAALLEMWQETRTRSDQKQLQFLIESCLDLCTALVILEARIKGELPAFEGICVVRERASHDSEGS